MGYIKNTGNAALVSWKMWEKYKDQAPEPETNDRDDVNFFVTPGDEADEFYRTEMKRLAGEE